MGNNQETSRETGKPHEKIRWETKKQKRAPHNKLGDKRGTRWKTKHQPRSQGSTVRDTVGRHSGSQAGTQSGTQGCKVPGEDTAQQTARQAGRQGGRQRGQTSFQRYTWETQAGDKVRDTEKFLQPCAYEGKRNAIPPSAFGD